MAKPVLIEGGTCRSGLHPWIEGNIKVFPTGRRACRECIRETDRERQSRDSVKRRRQQRDRYARRDPEKRAIRRDQNLRKQYGLSLAEYDAMLAAQDGACAICRGAEPGGKWNTHFHVDHDHEAGTVRGLLCGHCNVMLGNAKDEPARLRAAADYLEMER